MCAMYVPLVLVITIYVCSMYQNEARNNMYLTTQKSNIRTITRKETHTHKSRKKKQLSIVFVYKYIDFDMT